MKRAVRIHYTYHSYSIPLLNPPHQSTVVHYMRWRCYPVHQRSSIIVRVCHQDPHHGRPRQRRIEHFIYLTHEHKPFPCSFYFILSIMTPLFILAPPVVLLPLIFFSYYAQRSFSFALVSLVSHLRSYRGGGPGEREEGKNNDTHCLLSLVPKPPLPRRGVAWE